MIDPTSTSLITPTSTAATARETIDRFIDHPPSCSSSSASKGLKTPRWVLSENTSPAA